MSQLPPTVDPAVAAAAANQLTSSSLSGYNALPNPQVVTEGIRTGSTATLSTALQEGNPLFQSLLAGTPAGGTTPYGSPYGAVPGQINDPTDNLWNFNPQQSASAQKVALQSNDNASWRTFGQVPEFNFGWMDSVRKGDPGSIKKWQSLLHQKGFYQDPQYQVSGVWDTQSEAAFQGFMVSLATPQAIFAQDPKQKADASMFLNGLGFDVSTINARDPAMLAQIAQQWMGAQGPDAGTGTKAELQQYADQFGESALPQSYQAIIQSGFFQTVRDGLSSVLGITSGVPLLGGAVHGAVNLLTGNLDLQHLTDDPRSVRAQQIKDEMTNLDKLTPTDIANMAPALQAVQDDAGFLGFMDDYDHSRTKFLLASIYSLGDMVTGKFDGHQDNPFDPMSGVNLTAQAHQDNMFAGLFGDKAAQDNPAWAGMFNFAANVADDPTSYIPLVGELEAVQKARGIRTVARAIGDDKARTAFNNLLGNTVKQRVNDGYFKAGRAFVTSPNYRGVPDLTRFLGLAGSGTDHELAQLKLAQRAFDPATDPTTARDLFLNGDGKTAPGFGDLINSGRGVYNARAHWESLAQVKSTHILGKIRATGVLEEAPFHRAGTNPIGTGQFLDGAAHVAGMTAAEIKPLMDKYYDAALNNPNATLGAVHAIEDAIVGKYVALTGKTKAEFEAFVGKMRAGRSFSQTGNLSFEDRLQVFGPSATTGKETATVVKADNPDVARATQEQVHRLQRDVLIATENGATPEQVAVLNDQLASLQRPVPMLPSQLADNYHFPYSIYEMVAFKTPALRNVERFQAAMHLDAIMNTWKRITIGRISSALRIDLGDDAIRPFTFLIGQGKPVQAFSYLTQSMLHAFGLLVPGLRGRTLNNTMEMIEKNPEAQAVLQNIHKFLQESDPRIWQAKAPTSVGYAADLERLIRWHFARDPLSQAWLKAYAKDPATARDELAKYVRSTVDTVGKADPKLRVALVRYQQAIKKADQLPKTGSHDADAARFDTSASMKKQALDEYRKAAGKGAPTVATQQEGVRVRDWLEARKGHLSDRAFNDVIDSVHNFMTPYMSNSTIREMATTGKVNSQKLHKMVKDQANLDNALPIIPAPSDTPFARSMIQKMFTKFPDLIFEHMTAPMINQARVRGFIKMQQFYELQMRKYFADHPGRLGAEFEQMVHNASSSRALDWMMNNTYQGTRSVMGGTMRNIFPFYGATSNMDRFYMRQAAATPFVGSLIAHAALKSQQSQNAANQAAPGTDALGGVLAHLGFGGGEGMTMNPLHAFFLTSDGIGSMVPGTGPLFSPLWSTLSGNHTMAQILADVIPGAQSQIDFNTGQAKPMFPWLADLISGTSMALTGGSPDLGPLTVSQDSLNRMVDSKVQQRERETGQPVTAEDLQSIRQEVGRDEMLQGAASFTLPVSPLVTDVQGQQTAATMDQWRQQTTDTGKDAIIAQTLGIDPKEWQAAMSGAAGTPAIADLIAAKPDSAAAQMAYMDRRVSPEQRDAIAAVAPWVVSASTSKYQSTASVPGEPTTAVDLAQWQVMRKLGDITLLDPNTYVSKIADERDINVGWLKYDSYKNYEYETMAANGWTSTSPAFTAWKAAVFDPLVVKNLQGPHPAWWKQFGAGGSATSIPDLAGKTRSLRTLQTWEVIPQHSDYENTQSVLWRNAILLRDQAAQQIYTIRAAHGSRAETDMVMMALQQQLQGLAQQDPNFAAQLGSYRFGNWQDIVNLEADELATANYAGPRLQ